MVKLTENIAIKAPVKDVFEVLSDFESYPEIFDDIVEATVTKKARACTDVAFAANIVSRISYTLKMRLLPPHRITWSLVKGDFMESNDGGWELSVLEPNLTDAAFSVDIKFPFWVPESMAKAALKSNMPSMLASVKREAERRARRRKVKAR